MERKVNVLNCNFPSSVPHGCHFCFKLISIFSHALRIHADSLHLHGQTHHASSNNLVNVCLVLSLHTLSSMPIATYLLGRIHISQHDKLSHNV